MSQREYVIQVNRQDNTVVELVDGQRSYSYTTVDILPALVESYSKKGLTVTVETII